jgi:paired amphipathic helix protein Sin3a
MQHASRDTVTAQLMGKEDLTVDDAETAEQKWRNYVDSYVLVSTVPRSLRQS